MKFLKFSLILAVVSLVLIVSGCSGSPVKMGVQSDSFKRAEYDMTSPKEVSVSASGFQLLLFIPISLNSRQARAYAALERQANDGLISDVKIQEIWMVIGPLVKTARASATTFVGWQQGRNSRQWLGRFE